MLKQKTLLEVKRDDREYVLECAPDSPLGQLYDVLNEMRSYIITRITDEQKAQQEANKKADAVMVEEAQAIVEG